MPGNSRNASNNYLFKPTNPCDVYTCTIDDTDFYDNFDTSLDVYDDAYYANDRPVNYVTPQPRVNVSPRTPVMPHPHNVTPCHDATPQPHPDTLSPPIDITPHLSNDTSAYIDISSQSYTDDNLIQFDCDTSADDQITPELTVDAMLQIHSLDDTPSLRPHIVHPQAPTHVTSSLHNSISIFEPPDTSAIADTVISNATIVDPLAYSDIIPNLSTNTSVSNPHASSQVNDIDHISSTNQHNRIFKHSLIIPDRLPHVTIPIEPDITRNNFLQKSELYQNTAESMPLQPINEVLCHEVPIIMDQEDPSLKQKQAIATEDINTISFTNETKNLSIHGKITNTPYVFLCDTGASHTIIDETVYNDIIKVQSFPLITHSSNTFRSANNQHINVLGHTEIPFEIDNKIYTFQTFVAKDLAYKVILGKDFLDHFNAIIDFHHHTLVFQPNQSHTDNNSCKVHADQTYHLPPLSETIVRAYLANPFDSGSAGLVEPKISLIERYNICGSSCLVTVSDNGTIPYKILNRNSPGTIYHHTTPGMMLMSLNALISELLHL
ncbi:hypothetical protein AC249_AIPGENE9443 [Exaiptasia diaphana]|nr:hypothetical protein AC249_AIPGENE9443 [Exaiptasia diaphana]